MGKYLVNGGQKLKGKIKVAGSKNAGLKLLAATLLNEHSCTLFDIPKISDIAIMKKIILDLGGKITEEDSALVIDCQNLKSFSPNPQLVNKMRASIVTVGPLLARFGEAVLSQPGGCLIGIRPLETHLNAFKQLGIKISQNNDTLHFQAKRKRGGKVILNEMSVTATENLMMYLAMAAGESEIQVAAAEPEIIDLANFLNKMGAKIKGAGTPVIKIQGVNKLNAATHKVIPDRIETGTLVIAAALTQGTLKITNVIPEHLSLFFSKMQQIGVNMQVKPGEIIVKPATNFKPIYIDTRPYPGFSTDLQAPTAVLLTQAKGTSQIFETLFENRFNYVQELQKMGAKIKILDRHNIAISGPTVLHPAHLYCSDLRAGACLLLAALAAKGESMIDNVELIERGYETLDQRLNQIGAQIKRLP